MKTTIALIGVGIMSLLVYIGNVAILPHLTPVQVVEATTTPSCLQDMYTKPCAKRLTDDIAETYINLRHASDTLAQAQALYQEANTEYQDALDRYNIYQQ